MRFNFWEFLIDNSLWSSLHFMIYFSCGPLSKFLRGIFDLMQDMGYKVINALATSAKIKTLSAWNAAINFWLYKSHAIDLWIKGERNPWLHKQSKMSADVWHPDDYCLSLISNTQEVLLYPGMVSCMWNIHYVKLLKLLVCMIHAC